MTNETTASQPKSIGDDALSEFIEEYEWRTDDFCHKPTEAERLMLLDFAVNLDDSRAPAAQASATIQAAPTLAFSLYTAVNNMVAHIGMCGEIDARHDLVAKVMDELHKLDGGNVARRVDDLVEKAFMPKDQATKLAVEEYCHKADDATIQEPVMVAPHDINDDGHFATLLGTGMHRLTQKCIIEFVNSWGNNLAAPMVADPAGMAAGKALYESERPRLLVPKDWPFEDLPEAAQAEFNRRAATVKAVPSEALERVGYWYPSSGQAFISEKDMPGSQPIFAAPLADKTGGGE